MQETRVQSLGQEDPLDKEIATHLQHSCLGKPMNRGDGRTTVPEVTKELDTIYELNNNKKSGIGFLYCQS